MLARLRSPRVRWLARWFRFAGLVLLLGAFFLPLHAPALLALAVPGVILFLFGALAWLVRDDEPWRR